MKSFILIRKFHKSYYIEIELLRNYTQSFELSTSASPILQEIDPITCIMQFLHQLNMQIDFRREMCSRMNWIPRHTAWNIALSTTFLFPFYIVVCAAGNSFDEHSKWWWTQTAHANFKANSWAFTLFIFRFGWLFDFTILSAAAFAFQWLPGTCKTIWHSLMSENRALIIHKTAFSHRYSN